MPSSVSVVFLSLLAVPRDMHTQPKPLLAASHLYALSPTKMPSPAKTTPHDKSLASQQLLGAIYPSKYGSGRSTRAPLFQQLTRWPLYLLDSFLRFLRGFTKSSIQTKGPFMSCSKAARILALQHFRVENWNGLAWRSYVI